MANYDKLLIEVNGEAEVWIEEISEAKLSELIGELEWMAGLEDGSVEIVVGDKIESSYICEGCGAVWSEDGEVISGLSDEGSDWHCMACGLDQADKNCEEV